MPGLFEGPWRGILQRAGSRFRAHTARAGTAVRWMGPGRLPGELLGIDIFPDTLRVHGWAALPNRGVLGVSITVDGRPFQQATTGLRTQELAPGMPITPWSDTAGWECTIDRELLGAGTLVIGALVMLPNGLTERINERAVSLETPTVIGSIDAPGLNARVSSRILTMRGWFRTGIGYDHLDVYINGKYFSRARLMAGVRSDVAAVIDDDDAALSGWEAQIELPAGEARSFELRVEAVGIEKRAVLGTTRVVPSTRNTAEVVDLERVGALQSRTRAFAARNVPDTDGVHVLVTTHHLGLGGGQLYLQELLRGVLGSPDVRCTVISAQDGVLRKELEDFGVDVQIVGQTPTTILEYEQWIFQLLATVVDSGANVVLANTLGSFWGIDIAERLGIGSIWAIHESFTPEFFLQIGFAKEPDAGVRAAFLGAFASVDMAVFEADATLHMFDEVIAPGHFVRIDYGIDLALLEEARSRIDRDAIRRQNDIHPNDVLILCMGTYEPRKGQGLLAVAFSRIADEFPDAVVAMVGDFGGEFSQGVHRIVDKLELRDRIKLIPMTKDIDEWYSISDAFILASDIESLPRSMLEAMGFGVPVLGTAVFGVPELIEDGVNGMLFDPSSVTATTEVLHRFLSLDAAARRSLGEAGRETILATRSSAIYAAEYRTLMEKLIRKHAADA